MEGITDISNETWAKAAEMLNQSGKPRLKKVGQAIEELLSSSIDEMALLNFRSEDMVGFQYFTLEHLEGENIDPDQWIGYRLCGGKVNRINCYPSYIVEENAQELLNEFQEENDDGESEDDSSKE